MKIIIAGAGDIGYHIAKNLSEQNHDITLIDIDKDALDVSYSKLDVLTKPGDSSSVSLLKENDIQHTDLFLAVTTSEKNNIVSAILAKDLGAKRTIARVRNKEYLTRNQKQVFFKLGVDTLISPSQLAAREINRLLKRISLTDIFEFSEGDLTLIGMTLDKEQRYMDKPIENLSVPPELTFRMIAINRGGETIIPRGHHVLKKDDHVYFVTPTNQIDKLLSYFEKDNKKVGKVMIIGANDVCLQTAQLLQDSHTVKIIIEKKKTAKEFAEQLPNCLIIHGDPSDLDLLKIEGIQRMDAFIALTDINEVNILTSLSAKEQGVLKTIAMVDNIDYTQLSKSIGIDTIINKKLIAANNIQRFVRKGKIMAIRGIQGMSAEVIEFIINQNSPLTKEPVKNINLPEDSIIGGVVRNHDVIIPDGDTQLQKDDHVVMFTLPKSIEALEKMFR